MIRALEPDSCIVARVVCDLGAFGEKHGQASKKLCTKGGHYYAAGAARESNLSLLGGCLIGRWQPAVAREILVNGAVAAVFRGSQAAFAYGAVVAVSAAPVAVTAVVATGASLMIRYEAFMVGRWPWEDPR